MIVNRGGYMSSYFSTNSRCINYTGIIIIISLFIILCSVKIDSNAADSCLSEYARTRGYYYQFLSDDQKQIYDALGEANAVTPTSFLPGCTVETNVIYREDHPALTDNNALSDNRYACELTCQKARQMASSVSGSKYKKALDLHDMLCDMVTYDNSANCYCAYGALIDGKAVCSGYSKAYQLLCDYADIDCAIVYGFNDSEEHAWNIIRLDDGNWYEVDVSWDDQKKISHKYFGLSTAKMNIIHERKSDGSYYENYIFNNIPSSCGGIYENNSSLIIKTSNGMKFERTGKNTLKLISNPSSGKGAASYYKYTIPEYIKCGGKKYKVTEIADSAFKNDKKIMNIVIGKNIRIVGKNTFKGCNNLKQINIKSKKINEIGAGTFTNIGKKAVITVPKGLQKKYKRLIKGSNISSDVLIKY